MNLDLEKINLSPQTLEEAVEVIRQLIHIILAFKKENEWLREQLNHNSNHSLLPPSQDRKKKKTVKPKSGRNHGGQLRRTAWQRNPVPLENVDEKIECKPAELFLRWKNSFTRRASSPSQYLKYLYLVIK